MFHNDLAEVVGVGGSWVTGEAAGEKGKIDNSSTLFRGMAERGSIVGEL